MARFVKAGANDYCVECSAQSIQRNADKVLLIGDLKIPLCQDHLDALCEEYQADSLLGSEEA